MKFKSVFIWKKKYIDALFILAKYSIKDQLS